MTFWQVVVLGIVEGLTEFLPVSSTGHLILAGKVLGIPGSPLLTSFEITSQLGAILAVVILYGKTMLVRWQVSKRILVAFVPTTLLGVVFYKLVKTVLLDSPAVVLWALLVGGTVLIGFELWYKKHAQHKIDKLEKLGYNQALGLGVAQTLAMIPGVSRSAATILGGLWMGIDRATVVEFSFLLAVPTMIAATGFDLLHTAGGFSGRELWLLGLGMVVSFVVALASIRWFLAYVTYHSFIPFGVYRIGLALVGLVILYS